MATTQQEAPPRRAVDDRGRALPMTDAEARRQAERSIRALDALHAIGDPDEQDRTFDALKAGLDADRTSGRDRPR